MGTENRHDADLLSRPVRLAARLRGQDEAELEHLFRAARVLVRLEDAFAGVSDARETFLFAVNQSLRFCPTWQSPFPLVPAISSTRETTSLHRCMAPIIGFRLPALKTWRDSMPW
jgi:hypothetical protein